MLNNGVVEIGISCGCATCQSDYYMTEQELREGSKNGTVFDEGGFSRGCETCNTQLAGQFYTAHQMFDDKWYHIQVCEDCLCSLS